MAIREYKCPDCSALTEKLLMSKADNDNPPQKWKCGKCGAFAELQMLPSSISLGRSSFSEAPIDIQVGKDADIRWRDINDRQAKRNQVRAEAGGNGIVEVRKGEFKPISDDRRAVLADVERAVPKADRLPSGQEVSKSWLGSADD
jgi:ribosomal protein S27AE